MRYFRYTPPLPLSAYVSCLWYAEGFEGTHARERLLPNGESGIVFDLRDRDWKSGPSGKDAATDGLENDGIEAELHTPAIFCGARTDCFVIETSAQERVVGIQFHPGGAFPFLTMPASEVAGRSYELVDVWGEEALLLREQLLAAGGVGAIFTLLEQALRKRLQRGDALHPAIVFAARRLSDAGSAARVSDVTEQISLSARRFGELFREQTGLTPKAFHRVRRFQQVLQRLRAGQDESWAGLAVECGYFDQAHFIHDFRQFSGTTPSKYLRIATSHLNHLPLK